MTDDDERCEAAETESETDADADEAPAVDRWAAAILGIDIGPPGAGLWLTGRMATRSLPPYERTSAIVALADAPELLETVAFSQGEQTAVREVEVPTGADQVRWCPDAGVMTAWQHDGAPVIAWLEVDDPASPVRVVAVAAERAVSDAAADALVQIVRADASTWRGRSVLLDPVGDHVVVHRRAASAAVEPISATVLGELRRDLVVPLRQWERVRDVVDSRSVLVFGLPGAGKSAVVESVLAELDGCTVIALAPRCLLNGDLVRLAYDMAADAAPALVVIEDLDVVLGDWSASPAPEGLIELVAQLNGPFRRPGVFTLATTNDVNGGAGSVWQRARRFDRIVELGPPAAAVRRRIVQTMADRHGLGAATVDRVVSRTAGWTVGQLAELERVAVLEAAAEDRPVDLVRVVESVRSTVRAFDADGDGTESLDGSYL